MNDHEENVHAWWSVCVKNVICMIAWTFLAVFFQKWWIALFALGCMSDLHIRVGGDKKDEEM